MARVLVTGGTGGLGRDVVRALLAEGQTPQVLTHQRDATVPDGVELVRGDLRNGDGLGAALSDAAIVFHCASNAREEDFATDIEGTRMLMRAAQAAGTTHVIFISIVGVDRSDYPYYEAKREAERIVESSGAAWSILRATQFHHLVYGLLRGWDDGLERLRVAAGMRFQSVAREEVAARLIELARGAAVGYAAPMRGPETLAIEEMAQQYLAARKRSGEIELLPQVGARYGVFRSGVNVLPDTVLATRGRETWAEFLRGKID